MNARDNLFRQLVGGEFHTPPELAGCLSHPGTQRLTEREQDILIMISLGLCNKTIAQRMNISVRTVENHRSSLRGKLGTGTLNRLDAMLNVILGSSSQRVAALLQVDIQTVENKRRALRQLLN